MFLSSDEKNIHYKFSPNLLPVMEISSGQTVTVQTRDASNGQLRPGRYQMIEVGRLLPATGPIAITDALPGDALSIFIESIRLAPTGFAWLRPGLGLKSVNLFGDRYVQAFDVDGEKPLRLAGGLTIPLRPMVGIIGVSPTTDFSNRRPGKHGGNLDCVDVTEGNTLWLPVHAKGALLSLGDVHAAMGEGEVGGTGIEIDAEVTITVQLHPQGGLDGPVISTPSKTAFLESGPDVREAMQAALDRAVRWLARRKNITEMDATIAASISGNARICQLVNGDVTVSFELPVRQFTC